jgi:hypothetical protein
MDGIGLEGTRVGVIGATMVRGERGGEVGGVVVVFMEDMLVMEGIDAESGLQESLRRQLGLVLIETCSVNGLYKWSQTKDVPFTAI